jgi:hypothetical protein
MTLITPTPGRQQHSTASSRGSLRPAGLLLLAGVVVELAAEAAHPHHEAPNDHQAVFAEYAASADWLWVHLAQFGAAAIVVAGFVALHQALTAVRRPFLLDRLALVAAGGTLSAIMMNMAIDGVALKQAVDAWAAAPPSEKATRFASAETVRWLEWGAHAFFEILLGLTITAFGIALARRTRTRWHGVLAAPAGVLVTVDGALVGQHGFAGSPLLLIGLLLFIAVTVGLIVRGHSEQAATEPG